MCCRIAAYNSTGGLREFYTDVIPYVKWQICRIRENSQLYCPNSGCIYRMMGAFRNVSGQIATEGCTDGSKLIGMFN